MNNSKLVNVLRTFTKSEMKEFEKLVSSAFFNRGRNYLPFLKELNRFYPGYDDNKMTPEFIHSKMYPGKKFNRQVMWNMSSGLLNLSEEFLIYSSLKKNRYAKKSLLAEAFYEKKLSGRFINTVDEIERILDKTGISDEYFQQKARLTVLKKAYIFMEDKQYLIQKYVIQKGEYAILDTLKILSGVIMDMSVNSRLFNSPIDIDLPKNFLDNFNFREFINYTLSNKYPYGWVFEMSYYSVKLITEPGEIQNYKELKKLIQEHFNEFQKIEKNNWLTVLIFYCVNKNEESNDDYFRKELFEINKFQLRELILPQERRIPKLLYMQIIRNALEIGETKWVGDFIENYTPLLKISYQKPMRALGYAYLNFKLGSFGSVIENLRNVKFIDTRDKLNVRNMYIRTYYELGEIEAVISQIDSAKHFLNSSPNVTGKTKSSYLKSFNMLLNVISAATDNNIEELEFLNSSIKKDKNLIFKNWLIEKINEVINRAKSRL